jgi:hypothetical protein
MTEFNPKDFKQLSSLVCEINTALEEGCIRSENFTTPLTIKVCYAGSFGPFYTLETNYYPFWENEPEYVGDDPKEEFSRASFLNYLEDKVADYRLALQDLEDAITAVFFLEPQKEEEEEDDG